MTTTTTPQVDFTYLAETYRETTYGDWVGRVVRVDHHGVWGRVGQEDVADTCELNGHAHRVETAALRCARRMAAGWRRDESYA